jgi:hypothetical protein
MKNINVIIKINFQYYASGTKTYSNEQNQVSLLFFVKNGFLIINLFSTATFVNCCTFKLNLFFSLDLALRYWISIGWCCCCQGYIGVLYYTINTSYLMQLNIDQIIYHLFSFKV